MIQSYLKKIFKPKVHKSHNLIDLAYNYEGFTDRAVGVEAYHKNVIVYRCVNLIAQSAGHVPLVVNKGHHSTRAGKDHPVYRLLHRPNPEKAGADFFSEVIASKLLYGNAYILSAALNDSPPYEIYLLPAAAIEVVTNQNVAVSYRYNTSTHTKTYIIDQISRRSKILHLKNYHPTNKYYGLSCLSAASAHVELHQHATTWNNSLLKNGARPSGALIMKDGSGYLTDEQFARLQEQLYEKFTNSRNAGKPLLLEGGLDWREISISPKDMDFIELKNSAAREIALAFGVPPQLLGISGDNTYSNMQEARLALWEETLIPLLDKLSDALGHWFSHWYQDEIIIDFDRDSISALTEKRENLWAKIASADFMTINEKRSFFGLEAIAGGDQLLARESSQ
ncbi:phage portal protein [Candidatus Trichorickettsia mobilis]|uniref:phage portal protein n=1 Tax=Candidatus Trichorickettsia mobilis TaxID=1346319 RepID=UPI002930ECDD|nr:phage portal protein [Candidatus Trichorickettsia mobilis]